MILCPRFAVAAMVGEEEGPKTEFLGGMLPPRFDERSKPNLSVEEKFNKTVVFQLNIPAINQKCQVGKLSKLCFDSCILYHYCLGWVLPSDLQESWQGCQESGGDWSHRRDSRGQDCPWQFPSGRGQGLLHRWQTKIQGIRLLESLDREQQTGNQRICNSLEMMMLITGLLSKMIHPSKCPIMQFK